MASSKIIPPYIIGDQNRPWGGLNTATKDNRDMEPGESYDELNWLTGRDKDNIQLRRGQALLGTTRRNIIDQHVSGMRVGVALDGSEVPFYTFGQKIMYYNLGLNDTEEVDTVDILPVAANDEDTTIETYTNTAGSFVYLSSLNSNIYKIPVSNPGSVVNQNIADFHFNYLKFDRSRMIACNRKGASNNSIDKTGLYLSAIDTNTPSNTYTGEVIATGDGMTKTFSGVLPHLLNPKTAYGVSITDTVETFQDNRSGILIGSLGGTGTINYATQAYSVTFNTAPATSQSITTTFYQENATASGVADFNIDGTNFAKAQVFRQDDSGSIANSIFSYQGVEYCLHMLRSWQFQQLQNPSSIATAFTNEPYYEQIGVPYSRAAFQTGDGVIFINSANPAQPTFSVLQIPPGSTNLTVVPVKLSQKLDFSSFGFTKCVVRRWGDYDLIGVEVANQIGIYNTYNTICFARNIWSGLWNKLDYDFSCLDEFYGMLLGGDSLSPNVFTLFSGYDDDGEVINNYYNNAFTKLDIDGLKTVGYLHVEGLIQNPQNVQVGIALDGGSYVTEYVILGNGPYVNQGVSVGIGTYTEGSTVVGGQGSAAQFANKFEVDIPIHTDLFEYISFQFKALQVGYVQINKVSFKDIRFKRRRLLPYEDPEIDN